jgi:hypothetical protein
MLAVIVLPATHRPQGFVEAHNPHTPARALSAWQIILDGADQAERHALRPPSTRTVPNALAPAQADVATAPMRLSRLAVTCGRQTSAWRECSEMSEPG